jgi:predicted enzyme related to lactoylglutathione lyase
MGFRERRGLRSRSHVNESPERRRERNAMGQPVVHFEVVGQDPEKLRSYFSELFGWEFDTNNPMNYGIVTREGNTAPDGQGIGGGVGGAPEGYSGHVTFYVSVPDVEAALAKAEALGGERVMGPHTMEEQRIELGQFKDPEGHVIGLVRPLM